MDSLKKEILDFAQFISGIPQAEEHASMDYRRLLYAPYAGSWQNEWVMQVYESVIQLLKQIQSENRDVIEQRFKKIKHDYFLKKEILDFAQFISGIPQAEEHASMDYRRLLYAPYAGSWQNEWVMQVYESVIQLLKQIQSENRDVIEQRFKKIKHDYYELRNLPKKTSYGVGSQYERAYNKKYTTL